MPKRTSKSVSTNQAVAEKVEASLSMCHYRKCKESYSDPLYAPYCSVTCRLFAKRETKTGKKKTGATKYKPEYAHQDLYKYLKFCEESHLPRMRSVAGHMVPVKTLTFPSQRGYATFLGFTEQRINQWKREQEEFANAMNLLAQIQYEYLTSNGLSGTYNSKTANLILMSYHDLSERRSEDHTHHLGVVRSVYERADSLDEELTLPEHEDQK